jgi:uncharacterized protein involved in outer membrane biogenesis
LAEPSLVISEKGQRELAQSAAKGLGVAVDISGGVEISLLPYPTITMHNVKVRPRTSETNQFFRFAKVKIAPKLSSLVIGSLEPSTILLTRGLLTPERLQLLSQASGRGGSVSLEECEFELTTADGSTRNLDQFQANISTTGAKIKIEANFRYQSIKYKVTASGSLTGEDFNNAKLQVRASNLEASFSGDIQSALVNPKLSGQVSVNAKEYGITMTAQAVREDNGFSLSDIKLTGAASSRPDSTGLLRFTDSAVELDLALSKVEFKDKPKEDVQRGYSSSIVSHVLNAFSLPLSPETAINVKLAIDEVLYNKQAATNLVFNSNMQKGKGRIEQFTLSTPGEGTMNITGNISHNGIRPKFDGELKFLAKNAKQFLDWIEASGASEVGNKAGLRMKAAIVVMPYRFKLDNLLITLGDDFMMSKFLMQQRLDQHFDNNVMVRVDTISLDDFNIPERLDNLAYLLFKADYDKNGLAHQQITNDFRWLREIGGNVVANFSANRLTYREAEFEKVYVSAALAPNRAFLNHIAIDGNLVKAEGDFSFELSSFQPTYSLNLDIEKLEPSKFDKVLPSYTQMLEKYKQAVAVGEAGKDVSPTGISEYNFFGLSNYEGTFNIKLKELLLDKTWLQNIVVNGVSNNTSLVIKSSEADVYKGKLEMVGSITTGLVVPSVRFSFALNNIDPEPAMIQLVNAPKAKGYLSMSGALNARGLDYKSMLNSLEGTARIWAKQLTFDGIGLKEVAELPMLPTELEDKMKRLDYYSKYGSTVFKDVSGDVEIKAGIASIDKLLINSDWANGICVAKIDLKNNYLKAFSRFSFRANNNKVATMDVQSEGKIESQIVKADTTNIAKSLSGS